MTTEDEQLGLVNNLIVNILFCAAPKSAVTISRNKKIIKNAFYNIFGLYIKNTSQYVVFVKIFTISSRKYSNNSHVNMKHNDTLVFDTKEQVFSYLSSFIEDIEEHERFLNEDIVNNDNITGAKAVFLMTEWQKIITDYFNKKSNW
jgi:hypothetical protein